MVTVFVFARVETLTTNWHSEGGLVVVARDREHAAELIAAESPDTKLTDAEWDAVIQYRALGGEPRVFVFPDAGCC